MKPQYKALLLFSLLITTNFAINSQIHAQEKIVPDLLPSKVSGASASLKRPAGIGTGCYAILNKYRIAHGKKPLIRNVGLETIANVRAYRIATGLDAWSHYAFHVEAIKEVKMGIGSGENLARTYPFFESVVDAWDNSPKHQDVMLSDWCEVGIGQYDTYWVAHFQKNYNEDC